MSGSNDLKLANHFYLAMTVYSWAIYKREARATFWFFCFCFVEKRPAALVIYLIWNFPPEESGFRNNKKVNHHKHESVEIFEKNALHSRIRSITLQSSANHEGLLCWSCTHTSDSPLSLVGNFYFTFSLFFLKFYLHPFLICQLFLFLFSTFPVNNRLLHFPLLRVSFSLLIWSSL